MKIWMPFTEGGSGSDVFTRTLAAALERHGHDPVLQTFHHHWQYFPWRLIGAAPPRGTDIVLCNTWNGFAFRRPRTKLVTVQHLFVLDPALRPFRTPAQSLFHNLFVRHYEQASQRASDAQVAVSRYTADAHHRVLGDPKPRVILNGIDTEFFKPESAGKSPVTDRPLRLLFVGNLTRRKGIDLIPPIMRNLGEDFQLEYAVGLRTSKTLSELPNARSLGRLDHSQVREAYRRADLLLFPTRLEGLPLVAMEALACGTPVVASDSASLSEVIDHEHNGMLCRPNDADAFAAVIRSLRENPEQLQRLGENGRISAVRHFSLERMVQDYLELFDSLSSTSSDPAHPGRELPGQRHG